MPVNEKGFTIRFPGTGWSPSPVSQISRVVILCLLITALTLSCSHPRSHQESDGSSPSDPHPFIVFDSGLKRGIWKPEKQADVASRLGYDGIVFKGPKILQERMDALERHNLQFAALYHTINLKKTGEARPELEQAMHLLQGRGTRIWLGVKGPDETQMKKAVEIIRRLGRIALKNDLTVVIYPHTGYYIETTREALDLVKKVDLESVGVSFNLCHSLKTGQAGSIPQILEESISYLSIVQINGARKKGKKWSDDGWNQLIRPLDDSDYDLIGLMKKLHELGYEGPVCLQTYNIDLPPRDQ